MSLVIIFQFWPDRFTVSGGELFSGKAIIISPYLTTVTRPAIGHYSSHSMFPWYAWLLVLTWQNPVLWLVESSVSDYWTPSRRNHKGKRQSIKTASRPATVRGATEGDRRLIAGGKRHHLVKFWQRLESVTGTVNNTCLHWSPCCDSGQTTDPVVLTRSPE